MTFHDEHCFNCFSVKCEEDLCATIQCEFCKIKLHTCKLDDHQSDICGKIFVNCINVGNGCSKSLRRDKTGSHLEKCVASTVVCSSQWSRRIITPECKQYLKKSGKQLNLTESDSPDLDVQMAIFDQNEIVSGYNTSRQFRVRQRDQLNPENPVFPLRELQSTPRYSNEKPSSTCYDEDSSEDEIREKREKMKKSRLVFSNCYMCQIDPSAQHLHTLGNGTELEKLKKKRISPKTTDPFHENKHLKINLRLERLPDCARMGEMKKDGTTYTFRCSETVRRSEHSDHRISQHLMMAEYLDSIIVRCPNWSRGCTFTDSRLEPPRGSFGLMPHFRVITHIPVSEEFISDSNASEKLTLETLPLWFYELLESYLPSTSLFNLSRTSRNLRTNIFVGCQEKCYIEPRWEKSKTRDAWEQIGFTMKISLSEPPQPLKCCVPVKLSEHISNCEYLDPVIHEDERVAVFPEEVMANIGYEFEDRLLERYFDIDPM